MFDQLLNQFESVFEEAKQLKGLPKRSNDLDTSDILGPDITKPFGKAVSFNKSQRFKVLPKQQLKTSHIEWKEIIQPPKPEAGFTFKSTERFQQQKPKYVQTYINPNINAIKTSISKNVPIYKKPTQKDLSKSNVSVSTVASEQFRGPGLYKIQLDNKVKNGVFLKDSRFKQQKKTYEDTPLMINESQTRKKPPIAVMKKKTVKTRNLITIQQQQMLRQKMKYIYWRNIPLQIDRMFKNNQGAIIRDDYFNIKKLKGIHKRAAILMILNRLHFQRGGYENDIRTEMDNACAVVYRKSTPKPFKFSEMDPGPNYYYPTDDLIHNQANAFSFGKEGIKEKIVEVDYRDYEINEQPFKKGGNIVINPVHQQHRLTEEELRKMQLGPGFYDCLFSQTQKRNDIGLVKFQQVTDKNARQNNCVDIKQVNDGIYFPSYDAIDPNVSVPLYKEPVKVKEMLPDKVLFPEHWLFYDGDLNKVRAEIGKNIILAKNMSYKEYKVYKQKFQRFKEYLKIQKETPEVGQYEVKYDVVDPHIPGIDMQKKQPKGMIEPYTKPDQLDGDNLILNPKPFQDHLPNLQFKKMVGREENEIDKHGQPKQGDKLILNPQKPQKHIPKVDFKKQQGRHQQDFDNQEGVEGDILIIHPKIVQKHITAVNFEKQAKRQQIITQQNQLEQVILTNQVEIKPVIKGVPFSRLSSVRMVPLLRDKSRQKENKDEEV